MGSHGYDRPCELILLALDDKGLLKSRELADAAGLKKTQQVHYRYKEYLGPSAYGLMRKVTDPGRGGHVEWGLTQNGVNYVKYNREELERPQTSTEAIEVAAEVRDRVDSLEGRVSSTEGKVGKNVERINQLEDQAETIVPRQAIERWVIEAERWIEGQIDEFDGRLDEIEAELERTQ